MAKIAANAMARERLLAKPFDYDTPIRAAMLKRLYANSDVPGDVLDPYKQLREQDSVTIQTFPYLVSVFIAPSEWPKIVSSFEAAEGKSTLIISQLPGDKEYRTLQRMFHPDREPVRLHAPRPCTGTSRSTEICRPAYVGHFRIPPNNAVEAVVNAAFDLWKDIIRDPIFANETFLSDVERADEEFNGRSEAHAKLIEYLRAWTRISSTVAGNMIPTGASFAEIIHYVNNTSVARQPEDDEEDLASSRDENNEFTNLSPHLCVEKALRDTKRKKAGRPRLHVLSDEDQNEESE